VNEFSESVAGEIWANEITLVPEAPLDWLWEGFLAAGIHGLNP
jgi:hypothetical protein